MKDYLIYENLVSEFKEQLVSKLRLHGSENEILSLWVPDDDIVKSFHNLISALNEIKRDAFKISFLKKDFSQKNISVLEEFYKDDLNIKFKKIDNRIFCDLSNIQKSIFKGALLKESQAPEIVIEVDYKYGEVYQHLMPEVFSSIVNEYSKKNVFEKQVLNNDINNIISSQNEELNISIAYNSNDLRLISYSYHGYKDKKIKAICEMIGEIGIGLPVYEFCEHVILKVIHRFVALSPSFKKPAIILPNNIGYEFMFVNKVMQNLYNIILDKKVVGIYGEINFYDNPPNKVWLGYSKSDRDQKIIEAIRRFETNNNLNQGCINFHNITNDLDKWPIRINISLTNDVDIINRPNILRLLEKNLRINLEKTLQLYYEESKDLNKIRRL